jgi:hypothetical protein
MRSVEAAASSFGVWAMTGSSGEKNPRRDILLQIRIDQDQFSSGPLVNRSGFSEICSQQKSPGRCRGLGLLEIDQIRSILRDHRATAPTEAIVDSGRDKVGIAANAVGGKERAGRCRECRRAVIEEQMVVLNRGRPIRSKAIFETDTNDEAFGGLSWPASKKRQGTKSREVGHRRGSGRYGDLMAAPSSRVDVTSTGCGRRICTLARLEACNRHLGKRSERINERTVRRAQ